MDVDLMIFDFDETLFDHRGAACEGVVGWLSRLGVDAEPELISLWFDVEERFVAAWHRGEIDWRGQRRGRIRVMLAELGYEAGGDDAVDESFAMYLEGYERAWRAFPDAAPTLRLIERAGIALAVLSNGADYQQRAKLSACSLTDLAGRLFCSDVIGFAKPHPQSYLHVCDQLKVAPARVVHVGDRYDLDVAAAREAGLQAIHLDRDNLGPTQEPYRISNLTELPAQLGIPAVDS